MYLLIEHSGTAEHNEIAENCKDFAEREFGVTCESVVGSFGETISLYSENLEKVAEFNKAPDETELFFYLKHYLAEEDYNATQVQT